MSIYIYIYICMYVYIYILVKQYKDTFQSTIKMKSKDVTRDAYTKEYCTGTYLAQELN